MLRVALTGGAASGKGAVAEVWRRMGALVSNSDEVGRAMMQPGEPVFAQVVALFGPAAVTEDGTLDRRELARLAFAEGRLRELNAMVHPAVIAAQTAWLDKVEQEHPNAIAVVESALVLETEYGWAGAVPWRAQFNKVVLVVAPEEMRVERYVRRALQKDSDADTAEARNDALRRFAAQMPDAHKRTMADVVIENGGTLGDLRSRAESVYAWLCAEMEAGAGA